MTNCEYLFTEYAPACNEGLEPCYDICGDQYSEYFGTTIQANSEEAQGSFGSEQVDPNTGLPTLNASFNWKCGTGSTLILSGWYNWIYKSYETGTLEKENNVWKFLTLIHSSIERIGQTPPTHVYSHSLGNWVQNTSSDRRTANVDLQYVVYEQIIATGQTKSWEKSARTVCKAP